MFQIKYSLEFGVLNIIALIKANTLKAHENVEKENHISVSYDFTVLGQPLKGYIYITVVFLVTTKRAKILIPFIDFYFIEYSGHACSARTGNLWATAPDQGCSMAGESF